jgi:hypothetical protein
MPRILNSKSQSSLKSEKIIQFKRDNDYLRQSLNLNQNNLKIGELTDKFEKYA